MLRYEYGNQNKQQRYSNKEQCIKISFIKRNKIVRNYAYTSHWLSNASLLGTQDCELDLHAESHDSPCLFTTWSKNQGLASFNYVSIYSSIVSKRKATISTIYLPIMILMPASLDSSCVLEDPAIKIFLSTMCFSFWELKNHIWI